MPPADGGRDDRSRRHLGAERLDRVQSANVLVVGAGALGNEVVKNLSLLGLKSLTLVDMDRVSLSNLNRCVYFRPDQLGLPKVEAIRQALAVQSPDLKLQPHDCSVEDAPESIWEADVVALCVDSQLARYYVNLNILGRERRPWVVNGAMGRNFHQVQVLRPGETACLVCSWTPEYHAELFSREAKKSCDTFFEEHRAPFPSISMLSSLCSGVISAELVALLAGGEPSASRGCSVRYEQAGHHMSVGRVYRNPRCVEVLCRRC